MSHSNTYKIKMLITSLILPNSHFSTKRSSHAVLPFFRRS